MSLIRLWYKWKTHCHLFDYGIDELPLIIYGEYPFKPRDWLPPRKFQKKFLFSEIFRKKMYFLKFSEKIFIFWKFQKTKIFIFWKFQKNILFSEIFRKNLLPKNSDSKQIFLFSILQKYFYNTGQRMLFYVISHIIVKFWVPLVHSPEHRNSLLIN